jgi:hypothetical protein
MAIRKNTFLLKRSNVAGNVPAAGQILLGELALNTADCILYASGTTANSILPIGWDRVAKTGDTMTGTLIAPTISATTYQNLPLDIRVTGGTYNNLTGTATFTNNTGGTFNVTGFNGALTGYVTTNTTQTITGNKQFNNLRLIQKVNTAFFPTESGGNFSIGGNSGYDSFDFYSLDGNNGDGFGSVQIYSNPEEGNLISHTSLDNQISSILSVNQSNMYFRHIYGGQNTSLYINGITDKIIIEGTQNKFAGLGTSLITGQKNFEFPNESGTIALLSDITDTFVTGGTYNNGTGTLTLTNNTGGTFNVTGFVDTYVTGLTINNGLLTLSRNNLPQLTASTNNFRSISFNSNDMILNTATRATLTPLVMAVTRFDGTGVVDDAGVSFIIPEDYVGSPEFYFTWRAATSGTTTAKINLALYTGTTNNLGSLATAVETLSIISTPTNVNTFLYSSGTTSNVNFSGGDSVHVRIFRDPSDVNDTFTGALDMINLVFKYNSIS